jgi:hypothetical protein
MKILLVLILSLLLSSCWHPSLEDAEKLGFSSVKEMNRIINLGYKTKQEYDYRYKKYGFSSLKKMKAANNRGYKTKSDFDNRYKKFGFKSLDEMKSLRIQGYKTKKKYLSAKKNTAKWFVKECVVAESTFYEKNCIGKKVIWRGDILTINTNDDRVRIKVRDAWMDAIDRSLEVDSQSLLPFVKKSSEPSQIEVGQLIEFHGTISLQNWIRPDIENISFVKFETKTQEAARLLKDKEIEKQKKAELEKYMYNAKWLNDKYNIDGGVQCQKAIPKLAKYAYKWTDGFLEQKFAYYKQIIEEAGVLTLVGDKIQFQNGFGAWIPAKYWCSYDVRTDSVIDYGLY